MVEYIVVTYFTQIKGSSTSAVFKDFYLVYTFCGNLDRTIDMEKK